MKSANTPVFATDNKRTFTNQIKGSKLAFFGYIIAMADHLPVAAKQRF
jgi:hypothetical protein